MEADLATSTGMQTISTALDHDGGDPQTASLPGPAGHVRTLTEQTFDAEVLAAKVPVLVEFTATWCPPCRALAPILHKLAADNAGRLLVMAIDGDEQAALAARLRIKAFPTVIAFVGGREVARHVGLTTQGRLLELIEARG